MYRHHTHILKYYGIENITQVTWQKFAKPLAFWVVQQSKSGVSQNHVLQERHPKRVLVENEFMVVEFNAVYYVSFSGNDCKRLQITCSEKVLQ